MNANKNQIYISERPGELMKRQQRDSHTGFGTCAELDAEVSIDVLHVGAGGATVESPVLREGEATNSLESF